MHFQHTNDVSIEIDWNIGTLVKDSQYVILLGMLGLLPSVGVLTYELSVAAGVYSIAATTSDARALEQDFKYDPGLFLGGISVTGWWQSLDLSAVQAINQWMTRNAKGYDITSVSISLV